MEKVIDSVCRAYGMTPDQLMKKLGPRCHRDIRNMMWRHLVRDKGYSYAAVARRFGCIRFNVIYSVRGLEGAMEVQPPVLAQYREFIRKISSE